LIGAKDIKTTKSGETISPPRMRAAADARKRNQKAAKNMSDGSIGNYSR
jgi:hypothetical protein